MEPKPNISEQVLKKIRSGEVSMRPRFYFAAKIAGVAALATLSFLLSLLMLSFIFFSLSESGEAFLLTFGSRGVGIFLSLFPWLALIASVALLIGLDLLLRQFRFGYRTSILRLFLGATGIALLGGLLLSLTPLHASLLDRADHDQLPLLGGLYKRIHDSHAELGVFRGVVTSIATSSFALSHDDQDRDADDGSWVVIPPTGFDLTSLTPGARVYVAGDAHDGTISAYGVQKRSR